ncbi:unnamed protein product [Brugia pahangi]|uniref:Uncharacterized protein n=1 Tax=Brugia pahangi TaxID=6280 RepID=A0A0N4TM04_BRUPA|nr:unnamed protein product [Brugia pahangi]
MIQATTQHHQPPPQNNPTGRTFRHSSLCREKETARHTCKRDSPAQSARLLLSFSCTLFMPECHVWGSDSAWDNAAAWERERLLFALPFDDSSCIPPLFFVCAILLAR